jgi:hypothetical protein
MGPEHPLAVVGLILGMIGVVIMFIWGSPQPSFEEHVTRKVMDNTKFIDGTTAKEYADNARKRKTRYTWLSRLGLGLIGVAFLLQLIDAWL